MTDDTPRWGETVTLDADVLVIGGGSAGSVAAIKAKEARPGATVLVLEKANVRRSGAISMGMDGLNNAIIPGHATPEQYVKEITMANDGIVNQAAVLAYAERSFAMIQELDRWGVKFQKTESGDFDVKKVHHKGSYVLPMPEGYDLKKILTRVMRRVGVKVSNRIMATRLLTDEGRVVGAMGLHTRTGAFAIIRARAVILCCGAAGRLGLPASGYLYGTYENPTNAGDGYSMAFHAGAELTGIECFQINPLIKDYNGPACAYVTGPLGGHTVNARGHRFIASDYWSGQMMMEFYNELQTANGPVYLKLNHLAEETILEIERVFARHRAPQPRPLPRRARPGLPLGDGRDAHLGDRAVQRPQRLGRVDQRARRDDGARALRGGRHGVGSPQLPLGGHDLRNDLRGERPRLPGRRAGAPGRRRPGAGRARARLSPHAPAARPAPPPGGVQDPPSGERLPAAAQDHHQDADRPGPLRARPRGPDMGADNPHDLMRAMEVHFIRDCGEMAARASLARTESRWGLYHHRLDYPDMDNEHWFVHLNLKKGASGALEFLKRPVAPYVVPLDGDEMWAYHRLRIPAGHAGGGH
jgi:succinate dehydrogenase/fumarate reductase flavoprotein subunit